MKKMIPIVFCLLQTLCFAQESDCPPDMQKKIFLSDGTYAVFNVQGINLAKYSWTR